MSTSDNTLDKLVGTWRLVSMVTQEDRATALGTLYAESGKVTAEGARVRIAVDLAAHPQLAGVVLHRTNEYYGDRMRSTTEWAPSVICGGRMSWSITEWQRE